MVVQSKQEDDFLRGILVTEEDAHHWMGGSALLKEGQWMWHQNGDQFTYTNWVPGQPDNIEGREDCLMYWKEIKWNDDPCNRQHSYICEISHT